MKNYLIHLRIYDKYNNKDTFKYMDRFILFISTTNLWYNEKSNFCLKIKNKYELQRFPKTTIINTPNLKRFQNEFGQVGSPICAKCNERDETLVDVLCVCSALRTHRWRWYERKVVLPKLISWSGMTKAKEL